MRNKLSTLFSLIIVFFICFSTLNLSAQEPQKTKKHRRVFVETSAKAMIYSLKNDQAMSLNSGLIFAVSDKFSVGLFNNTIYEILKDDKQSDKLSDIGLSGEYTFFEGKSDNFWKDGAFRLRMELGIGGSDIYDVAYYCGDFSLKWVYKKIGTLSIGCNYRDFDSKREIGNKSLAFYCGFGVLF